MDEMKKILLIIVGIAVGVKLVTILIGSGVIGKLFRGIKWLISSTFSVNISSDTIWNAIGLIRAIVIVFALSFIVTMFLTVAVIKIKLKWTWGM